MRRMVSLAAAVAMVLLLAGPAAAEKQWTAERVGVIEGLETPESVLPSADGQAAWVSNVVLKQGGPWTDDGVGYISRLSTPDEIETLKWRAEAGSAKLNAPKGLCMAAGSVWAADNGKVVRFPLEGPKGGEAVAVPGAKRLNDMATDGEAAWVSDIATGKIHRLTAAAGHTRTIDGPAAINGITFHDGAMYAVSWGEHEIYEVDPSGEEAPRPFGLADHFQNLDGIEVLGDGSMIVSDFTGGKVSVVTPDRKNVYTLVEMQTPADIGLDRRGKRLYVPSLQGDFINVYKLRKK